jgi:hypothetical protein
MIAAHAPQKKTSAVKHALPRTELSGKYLAAEEEKSAPHTAAIGQGERTRTTSQIAGMNMR